MKLRTFHSILLLALAALVSCEHSRLTFGGDPDTDYHRLLRSLTHYEKLFALNKTPYETYVTKVTPELSEKYVDEYARIFKLTEEEKTEMQVKAREDYSKFEDYMVAHYASEIDSQKLEIESKDIIVWKFFLKDIQTDLVTESLEVTPVKLGTQRNYFYPYLSGWNRLYRVRFSKNENPNDVFIMTGPSREITFSWK